MHMAGRTLRGPVLKAGVPVCSLRKLPCRGSGRRLRTWASVEEPEKREVVEVAEDGDAPKKYYAPAPGNPNVILEYDEPPVDTRKKGRFDLVAVILLTLGCAFILLFFVVIVSLV